MSITELPPIETKTGVVNKFKKKLIQHFGLWQYPNHPMQPDPQLKLDADKKAAISEPSDFNIKAV